MTTTGSRPAVRHRPACPTCHTTLDDDASAARLREELRTAWWSTSDQDPGRITVTRHCGHCQPHTVYIVVCLVCGDGPILAGQLARDVLDSHPQRLPAAVVDELTRTGWRPAVTTHATGWVCGQPTPDHGHGAV
ncbi:hypothetical protein ACFCV3_41550 [Kribbella sp. NPDC056345]|uniref:hypothetical protein n=1 Tax=Kribbella sp. NPDC056345 TaxID=3345789 RepID=UPI0035D7B5F0